MREYAAIAIPDKFNAGTKQPRFYALRRTDDGFWVFPGGKIEQNELPIVAAARELKEETGITAHSLKFIGKYIGLSTQGEPWLGHYFALLGGDTVPNREEKDKFSDHAFFSLSQMEGEQMNPEYQAVIDLLYGDQRD